MVCTSYLRHGEVYLNVFETKLQELDCGSGSSPIIITVLFAEAGCTVGIERGLVPDSAMTASSYWDSGYEAFYGRLNNDGDPYGFWHPTGNSVISFLAMVHVVLEDRSFLLFL